MGRGIAAVVGWAAAALMLYYIHRLSGRLAEPTAGDDDPPLAALDDRTLSEARDMIAESLSPSPISIDDLVRQCDLSPAIVLTVLLELELAGRIERQAGHRVAMIG